MWQYLIYLSQSICNSLFLKQVAVWHRRFTLSQVCTSQKYDKVAVFHFPSALPIVGALFAVVDTCPISNAIANIMFVWVANSGIHSWNFKVKKQQYYPNVYV